MVAKDVRPNITRCETQRDTKGVNKWCQQWVKNGGRGPPPPARPVCVCLFLIPHLEHAELAVDDVDLQVVQQVADEEVHRVPDLAERPVLVGGTQVGDKGIKWGPGTGKVWGPNRCETTPPKHFNRGEVEEELGRARHLGEARGVRERGAGQGERWGRG